MYFLISVILRSCLAVFGLTMAEKYDMQFRCNIFSVTSTTAPLLSLSLCALLCLICFCFCFCFMVLLLLCCLWLYVRFCVLSALVSVCLCYCSVSVFLALALDPWVFWSLASWFGAPPSNHCLIRPSFRTCLLTRAPPCAYMV